MELLVKVQLEAEQLNKKLDEVDITYQQIFNILSRLKQIDNLLLTSKSQQKIFWVNWGDKMTEVIILYGMFGFGVIGFWVIYGINAQKQIQLDKYIDDQTDVIDLERYRKENRVS